LLGRGGLRQPETSCDWTDSTWIVALLLDRVLFFTHIWPRPEAALRRLASIWCRTLQLQHQAQHCRRSRKRWRSAIRRMLPL